MLTAEQNSTKAKIAVIGGGVAGSTAALHMAELGHDVLLIEKGASLVNGPPICHLHAGGNLYREISEPQCIELLKQSIDTVRLYPHTINVRPTVIAVPDTDSGNPLDLLPRLNAIQSCYRELVSLDARNQVLGNPEHYYRCFDKNDLVELSQCIQPSEPNTLEDWMIPFAKHADLAALKYPVVAVEESGWSVFRLAATVTLSLDSISNCDVELESELTQAKEINAEWQITYQNRSNESIVTNVDFLVNACGFETGTVDDMVNKPRQRLVEFKAAYVTQWQGSDLQWPEVIFHGERGTPQGMAQLTPYAGGIFQLHGMTENITLFEGGLVSSNDGSSQPILPLQLSKKITQGWCSEVAIERSQRAIEHIGRYMPSYLTAVECGKPLFGAQQIPGVDETLRAADVTFESSNYARLEVVKGSSAIAAARKIAKHWNLETSNGLDIETLHPTCLSFDELEVERKAIDLAKQRGYPIELAMVAGARSQQP